MILAEALERRDQLQDALRPAKVFAIATPGGDYDTCSGRKPFIMAVSPIVVEHYGLPFEVRIINQFRK